MKNSLDNCKKLFPEWDKKTDNYCALQKEMGNNEIAMIGDSHANHLFLGMSEAHKEEGVAVFPASCASPLLDTAAGLYTYESLNSENKIFNGRQNTYKLINQAYKYVLSNKKIRDVILAHNPMCSYNGNVMDMRNPSETNGNKIIERGLRRSLDALTEAGKRVTIVIDNPEIKFEPKACIVRPLRLTRAGARCSYDRSIYDQNAAHKIYNTIIRKVVKDYPSVRVVDLSKKFCNDKTCTLFVDGHEVYEDRTHLNKYGSRYVAPFILGNGSDK
ncbi:SGNH hydrolase domain-containing protein [Mangrovibacter sp. SLW1]